MKKFLVLFFLFSICFVSCAGDDDDDGVSVGGGSGPCKGVICSGHGTCYEIGDNLVSCNCEEGYVAEGIDCVLDDGNGNGTDTGSDPCAGVTCSGHGTCYEKDGKPACNCEQGYDAQGTNCVEEGSSDPCAGKDCNNHGTCNPDTGQCECEEGWRGDNCESFDNGGPWKLNLSGAVNKDVTLTHIFCAVRESSGSSGKYDIQLSLTNGERKDLPSIGTIIHDTVPTTTTYENTNIRFDYTSSGYYLSTGADYRVVFTKYIEDKVIEGSILLGSTPLYYGGNVENNSLIVNPKTLNFKCHCIYNGTNDECGWAH